MNIKRIFYRYYLTWQEYEVLVAAASRYMTVKRDAELSKLEPAKEVFRGGGDLYS